MTDKEALMAFIELTETEGIIPALESSFALAYAKKIASNYSKKYILVVKVTDCGD